MEKLLAVLQDFGLKITGIKEVAPFTLKVSFVEGHNDFYTKFFFTGPKGNTVSKHDGKFVLSVIPVSEGYHTGKLLEKESHFFFKPLPTDLEMDGKVYRLEYRKDVWGF